MLNRVVLILLSCFFSLSAAFAQYTQIGNGAFTRTNIGPIVSDSSTSGYYSRMAYIWPEATLNGLEHGDTITALSFKSFVFDTLRGTCNMKIYIKGTSQADFGAGSLNWAAESRDSMTLVYDDNPSKIIGNKPSYVPFIFNQTKGYEWDTTNGRKNLEVLIQFTQNTNQVEPLQWYVETNGTVIGFSSSNEGKFLYDSSSSGIDSITNRQSIFKPTLRVHYPKHDKEVEIQDLYSLGKLPLLMKQPDSIKVALYNSGKQSITNGKVYLRVAGANEYEDTLTITNLNPLERKFVYFDQYNPENQGVDSLIVSLPSDGVSGNNEATKLVEVNYNVYSHTNPFLPNSGGVGFNGQTGDFVAKFYVEGSSYINQIRVDFSFGGQHFQLGIWEDDGPGGTPGTELFMSDTNTGIAGTYILPVLPRVKVSGGYFVGIRQASGTNVGFSFQYERPVRPNTFYFTAPAGDSTWTPFSPGFDFNVNIQPRLQVANDLAVLGITSPVENDTIRYSLTDSLPLQAELINYGYLNQGLFIAKFEVLNRFGQSIFSKDKFVSLDAGDSTLVHFGKLGLFNLGEFTARASIALNTDSVVDNNSASNTFYLVKDHDVAVDRFFAPSNNDTFSLNRESVFPTVRIANYGVQTQTDFNVVCELIGESGNILSRQVTTESLTPEGSKIVSFDSVRIEEEGRITLRSYTELFRDSFPINDTSSLSLISVKIEDIEVTDIDIPEDGAKYAERETLRPFVDFRNDGRLSYDTVYFYATIYGQDSSILYEDTAISQSSFFSTSQIIFKPFISDSVGEYRFLVEAFIAGDQKQENDTMSSDFSIVTANDLQIIGLLYPEPVNLKKAGKENVELIINNNGLNTAEGAGILLQIIDNQNQQVLRDTKSITLNSFTLDTVSFGEIDMNVIGDYYVEAKNLWVGEDEVDMEDSFKTTFIIRPRNDLALIKVTTPVNNAILEFNTSVTLAIQILSAGLEDVTDIAVSIKLLNPDGTRALIDTLRSDMLGSGRADLLILPYDVSLNNKGVYTLEYTSLNQDDVAENNTLTSTFTVVLRNDIAISEAILPVSADRLPSKQIHRPRVKVSNNGVNAYQSIPVYSRIYVGETMIFDDTRFIDLIAGETIEVTFDSTLKYESIVDARGQFIVSALDDQISANDTLNVDFEFVQGANVVGTENLDTRIYPNPFSSQFTISADYPIERLRLRDLSGKLLLESYPNRSEVILNPSLTSGTYLIEITINDNTQQYSLVKTE